jgi:hypothetical protein
MGNTLPGFSQRMAAARRRAPLKRSLPNAGQAAFDRVFDGATRHGHAGGWVPRPWAFGMRVMALRLEQWQLPERMPVQVEPLSAPPTQSCGRCSRPTGRRAWGGAPCRARGT